MVKTVKITDEAHNLLNEVGLRGETFSEIIVRLVEHYKRTKK
jgi:predicted CopG family antitoxin